MTIGIIPAAGKAERMGGIPKFLLPIPGGVLIDRLAIRMATARTGCIHLGINDTTYKSGLLHEGVVTIWNVGETHTMSETVLRLGKYDERHENVLFGMPDTYFEDEQAFVKLSATLDAGADVAVGVFQIREGQHTEGGMVNVYVDLALPRDTWRVKNIVDKPAERVSDWIWGILAWRSKMWDFIKPEMPHVGFAVQAAIEGGLDVRAVKCDGQFFDAGTPSRYFSLINYLTGHE